MSFNAQEKKSKTLTETIVIVVVLALLMMSFIHYFFKDSDKYNAAGFSALANAFSVSINNIHAQWIMDNTPTFVIVKPYDGNDEYNSDLNTADNKNKLVPVNKKGWVDVEKSTMTEPSRCQQIWHHVLERPLFYMKEPLSVIEILKISNAKSKTKANKVEGVICQYRTQEGSYFEYDTTLGKVSRVIQNKVE